MPIDRRNFITGMAAFAVAMGLSPQVAEAQPPVVELVIDLKTIREHRNRRLWNDDLIMKNTTITGIPSKKLSICGVIYDNGRGWSQKNRNDKNPLKYDGWIDIATGSNLPDTSIHVEIEGGSIRRLDESFICVHIRADADVLKVVYREA